MIQRKIKIDIIPKTPIINGSAIPFKGGYAFAYRDHWGGANISIVQLDKDFKQAGESKRLNLSWKGVTRHGKEDPRLYFHKGRLHLWYIGWNGNSRFTVNKANVLFVRLSDSFEIEDKFFPQIPKRNEWEKNHAYFDWRNTHHCVYSINPHRVLQVESNTVCHVYESTASLNWSGGHLRGGASPILVGNEFYHFFHGMKEINGHRRYSLGCYVFEARPPFRIKRMTPEPIDGGNYKKGAFTDIIFPCGAFLQDNQWVITCGIADRWTEVRFYDRAEVESCLSVVKTLKISAT